MAQTHNGLEFFLIIISGGPVQNLLEQITSFIVSSPGTLEILSIVELHGRVGLLQGFGKHCFLRWLLGPGPW